MKRSKNGPETGPNSPKTGQNWPFLAARASGEQRTASEARGSTVPAIRKPHPALCHPGGSRVLRWLTFCSAHDGHRTTQERTINRPKQPKNGPKLVIFGCASERRAANSERSEKQHRPCYTKAQSSKEQPKRRQKRGKRGKNGAKLGHLWSSGGEPASEVWGQGSTCPVLLSEGPIKHAKRAKQAKTRRSVVERSMQTGQEQPWLGSLYCLNPNPTVYR